MQSQQIKEVFVTNVVCNDEKKYGFGRDLETNTNVFIPPHVIKRFSIEYGDTFYADLVPNDGGQLNDTPYKVQFVYDENGPFAHLLKQMKRRVEDKPEPQEQVSRGDINKSVLDILSSMAGAFLSTKDLVDMLERKYGIVTDSGSLGRIMEALCRLGRVARMQLHSTPQNKRASRTYWSDMQSAEETFDRMVDNG